MTKLQRYVFSVVSAHHLRGLWYRAASSGERVTLAQMPRECRAEALGVLGKLVERLGLPSSH